MRFRKGFMISLACAGISTDPKSDPKLDEPPGKHMIVLKKMRDLDIVSAGSNTRPLHLSAASGLVCLDAIMYVVADDELHLGAFPTGDCRPGHLIRICEGALPDAKAERKRRKPDFEALTLIPPSKELPHGALLAVGSGSRPNRRTGVRVDLDEQGFVSGDARKVDLSFILDPLGEEFPDTNVEGAVVVGQELRLFQRGNKRHTDNAIIRYPLEPVLDAVISGRGNPIAPSRSRGSISARSKEFHTASPMRRRCPTET